MRDRDEPIRVRGLYRNGHRWWLRTVRAPVSGRTRPLSTGTPELSLANEIALMVAEMHERRLDWQLLEKLMDGLFSLRQLFEYQHAGRLDELRQARRTVPASLGQIDMEPLVDEYFSVAFAEKPLTQALEDDYRQQLRRLIAPGIPLPRGSFSSEYVAERFRNLSVRGRPMADSTRKQYLNTWLRFFRWARTKVPLRGNLFDSVRVQGTATRRRQKLRDDAETGTV